VFVGFYLTYIARDHEFTVEDPWN